MAFKSKTTPVIWSKRRFAGGWLRQKLLTRTMLLGSCTAFALGLLVADMMNQWLPFWPYIATAVACMVIFVVVMIEYGPWKWRSDNLEKGIAGEQRIGQVIEHALISDHCAVAHGVSKIARVGDIDHLIATPLGLLVVETKYRRVPRKEFPEVLRRISQNVKAVREWAPKDTLVKGCLVLVEEEKRPKKSYNFDGEDIFVRKGEAFRKMLHSEARVSLSTDSNLSSKVWMLGQR